MHVLDFSDIYCGPELCASIIGNRLVYRDEDHLTAMFSATLESRARGRASRGVPPADH